VTIRPKRVTCAVNASSPTFHRHKPRAVPNPNANRDALLLPPWRCRCNREGVSRVRERNSHADRTRRVMRRPAVWGQSPNRDGTVDAWRADVSVRCGVAPKPIAEQAMDGHVARAVVGPLTTRQHWRGTLGCLESTAAPAPAAFARSSVPAFKCLSYPVGRKMLIDAVRAHARTRPRLRAALRRQARVLRRVSGACLPATLRAFATATA